MIHINHTVDISSIKDYKINAEVVDNGWEVVDISKTRQITDPCFRNVRDFTRPIDKSFHGVGHIDEAYELMRSGCPEITKTLKEFEAKINLQGESKRVNFSNQVVGFVPVVTLVLQNVPTNMVNIDVKPIKNKVLTIFYEIGASAKYEPYQFKDGGCKLLSALMKLEMSGYRVNLYGFASFAESYDADMLVIKLKDARQPIDLQRLSFPLAHAGFFRTITWDWYFKVPGGKFRSGFGHPLCAQFSSADLEPAFEQMFHTKCVVLGLQEIITKGEDALKKRLTGGK